jgi:hypothetical protein
MPTFIFNNDLANRIAAAITGTPKTAREIAKELGEDKHVVNQHLYKMADLNKSDDKVPTWSHPESDEEEDDDDDVPCEHCGCKDGSIMFHSFGAVALCDKCSNIDEQPHCPRTHRDHEHDPCEDCVAGWAWIDERVPITYKGTLIGYSKPGEMGIHKFSHRHQ